MFLTENVDLKAAKYDETKIDPSFLYEAVLEANEAYHDICMKMIKCEHHCIVTEDTKMLNEAEGEAKKSFKEIIANLLKKIKEALVNFKNFMVEQLAKLGKLVARVVTAPVRGVIAIAGGVKALKQARKDIETIVNANVIEDVEFVEIINEAEETTGETVDAKQATTEAKNIFEKLKAAVSKLNFFRTSAEKAASEGDEQQAHKKLTAVSAKISKAFAKIRSAIKLAASAIWSAMKTAGKAVVNTAKKAASAVTSKTSKKTTPAALPAPANESVLPEIFLEDMMYHLSENEPLNESTNLLTPVYLLYQSYTGHSMKRYEQLEDSFNKMKKESDRRRLLGRIGRSIATAEHALDMSNMGKFKKFMTDSVVGFVAKNLPACKAKTKEYLSKLNDLKKKVESKKFDK